MTKFSKILVEVEVEHTHGELTKHEQLEQNPNQKVKQYEKETHQLFTYFPNTKQKEKLKIQKS